MSMIDLFACLFAQHLTCHWCLSALCWWVRCSCPLLPAISSCGRGLLVCACVGLAGGLVWFGCFFPLFVGVVWSLRRPSAVCFLGVVVLASAAAAALHQCAVYLGAVHCTKSTHGLGCSWCLLLSNHSENHLENWSRIGISIRSDVHSKVVWVV